MTDQKAENLLNLAVDTSENEREKTEELNVGFDREARTWELIVKFNGDLRAVLEERYPQVSVRELTGGFAILIVPEGQVEAVIALPEIEYAEKPKRLFFAINQARAASCIPAVQRGNGSVSNDPDGRSSLSGKGVLVAVLDSGIDYYHDDFRNGDGTTRILYLEDQVTGEIYTKERIDQALAAGSRALAREIVPSFDTSGHGTAVTGIAAGNGRESGGIYRGVAYESDLLIVRLGVPAPEGFPRTTQLMEGLDFVIQKAAELGRPVAVNLSFGNTYGSHDGNSLLERYIDTMAGVGRNVIVIGSGNEGDMGGHTSVQLVTGQEQVIELSVAPYEPTLNVQLWKAYEDDFDIYLVNPSQTRNERISENLGPYRIQMGATDVLVYYGEPSPYNQAQEIYFDFIPGGSYVESGIWKLILRPRTVVEGQVNLWLPSAAVLNRSTRFLRPTPETTLTIPSTASRAITVGAYDDSDGVYAPFSGRGNTRTLDRQKPDLAAPGVAIVAPASGGGYQPVTGTSFAAPFVTGAAALLMEWGIVKGNDPYLYGEKVRAYLRKGARELPSENVYPNSRLGFGALCVADSLPD